MDNSRWKLDSTQSLLAIKSTLAILVGYFIALSLEWKASSVIITIIVLQTATLGTTLTKSLLRIIGTVAGALLGVIFVAVAAQDREVFILLMAALTGGCIWANQSSRHQYAWQLVVLTAAIVGWPSAANPLNTFQTLVDRLTAVGVGILISSFFHGVIFPIKATREYEKTLHSLLEACHQLCQISFFQNHESETQRGSLDQIQLKILNCSELLNLKLDQAISESSYLKRHLLVYQKLNWNLQEVSLESLAFSDCCRQIHSDENQADLTWMQSHWETLSQSFESLTAHISVTSETALTDLNIEPTYPHQLNDHVKHNSSTFETLEQRINRLDVSLQQAHQFLTHTKIEQHDQEASITVVTDLHWASRLSKSLLAGFQVFLCAWFMILFDWPAGLQAAMIPIMVIVFINSTLPIAFPVLTILKGLLASLPIAMGFYFYIMPQCDSLWELSPWLILVHLPFMYFMASKNPGSSLAAMIGIIFFNVQVSISKTPPNYDFVSFMNTYLGTAGGMMIVIFLDYLLETRSSRRSIQQLISVILTQTSTRLSRLSSGSASSHHFSQMTPGQDYQLINLLSKLRKLSGTVNYRIDSQVSREQMSALLSELESLVLRTVFLSRDLPLNPADPNSSRDELDQLSQKLLNINSAMQSGQAISESASFQSSYLRPLSRSISQCQQQIQRINWQRWSQAYF